MAVKLSALKVGDVLYQATPVGHRRRFWTYTVTEVASNHAVYVGNDDEPESGPSWWPTFGTSRSSMRTASAWMG